MTQIELRAVTPDDFDAVIALRVAEAQRDYVHSNVETLAWAYVAPDSHPLAIYADTTPVGLVSYGYVPADGRCWIIHLMVGEQFQQRGFGRAALAQLLTLMADVSGGRDVAVAVDPDNAAAIRLYETFGFTDTGMRQNGEVIMRLATRPPQH